MTIPKVADGPRVDRYFEAEVMSADPVKLVLLLYRGALGAVAAAGVAMAAGNAAERSRQITKAWNIVMELRNTLNQEQGGEIAQRLGDLYGFVGQRLLDAKVEQSEEPLLEVAGVLGTLFEGWQSTFAARATADSAPAFADAPELKEYRPLSVAC